MNFPHLFSPIKILDMQLRNRIVMTAMHLGYTPQGEVTQRLIDFYEPRARGGVGLIIVGGCPIDEYGGMAGMIDLSQDKFVPGLKRLTEAVQSHGAKIAAQLYQAGRYAFSAMIGGRKPFSASAVRSRLTGETPRALELHEIPAVQDKFAEAAVRAKQAGFDAVEVLGSAGYLISQFLSPLTNKREDEYGGPLENRMRFGIEVVEKVRAAVGPNYPILFRIAGNDFMEGGHTNKEARIFAAELEKAGVDLFNVTGGWHETRVPQLTMFVPRRAFVYLAEGIKSAVSVPVLASNRINDPSIGEEIIRNGEADMVTMARALIVDPELPNKAREGKEHLIYHCVACNQGCFDNIFQLKPVTCLVNPRAGQEREFAIEAAATKKKVLVIGGGPAGMKAACTAAQRGHGVILVERGEKLGGQIPLNYHIPGRREMLLIVRDLENNLRALGVDIRLGQKGHKGLVEEIQPDAVILATGARPIQPAIAGVDRPNVVQAWDLLSGKKGVGKRVVIIGGNAVGLETALYLANIGTLPPEVLHFLVTNKAEDMDFVHERLNRGCKSVTVVEMTGKVGSDIGLSTRWTVLAELRRLGVTMMTNTKAVAVSEKGIEVEKPNEKGLIEADSVVLAVGSKAEDHLEAALKRMVQEVYVIGDAKEPRNALHAIREGFMIGLKL